MAFTIAVVTDLHYASSCPLPRRRGEYADILLARVIHRLNHMIKPDVLLVLGDCLDAPQAPDALERLRTLKEVLDRLECPAIVIPGNHDPAPDVFYGVMERPAPVVDIGPVRFLSFLDREEVGYHARRLPHDLDRMRTARAGHDGPVVFLQHVPLFPPGLTECPYGYTNAEEIVEIMAQQAITLSIGGHYHGGSGPMRHRGSVYLAVKALCEEPFSFSVISVDEDTVCVTPHALRLPPGLDLVDRHVHSEYAYCGRNMSMAMSVELAKLFGLSGMVFTEHTGQLYCGRDSLWREGLSVAHQGLPGRMPQYWRSVEDVVSDTVRAGLEVDADFHGTPVLLPEDRHRADLILGAVHFLPASQSKPTDVRRLAEEFLGALERLIPSGIHVLAHPFRIFRRSGVEVPTFLYRPVVDLLRRHGVAAELNFHTNSPDPEFFRLCISAGVKISLGSDSHEQYEVGELAPHLQFLADCGYDGDLRGVLL